RASAESRDLRQAVVLVADAQSQDSRVHSEPGRPAWPAYCCPGTIYLSAAVEAAPATMQPSASAVWPAWPHHWVLRTDAGPFTLSWSIEAMASRRTRPNSNVSA